MIFVALRCPATFNARSHASKSHLFRHAQLVILGGRQRRHEAEDPVAAPRWLAFVALEVSADVDSDLVRHGLAHSGVFCRLSITGAEVRTVANERPKAGLASPSRRQSFRPLKMPLGLRSETHRCVLSVAALENEGEWRATPP